MSRVVMTGIALPVFAWVFAIMLLLWFGYGRCGLMVILLKRLATSVNRLSSCPDTAASPPCFGFGCVRLGELDRGIRPNLVHHLCNGVENAAAKILIRRPDEDVAIVSTDMEVIEAGKKRTDLATRLKGQGGVRRLDNDFCVEQNHGVSPCGGWCWMIPRVGTDVNGLVENLFPLCLVRAPVPPVRGIGRLFPVCQRGLVVRRGRAVPPP